MQQCCAPLHRAQLFAAPRTVARQAPLPKEFSRQEFWSGVPFPTPGDLADQGSNPCLSLASPALGSPSVTEWPVLRPIRLWGPGNCETDPCLSEPS